MKHLFKIAQEQTFKFKSGNMFKNKLSDGKIIRNVKYIYCENVEIAKQLYVERYGLNYNQNVISDWGDWYFNIYTDELNVLNDELRKVLDLKCKPVKLEFIGTETLDDIIKNMFGIEFLEFVQQYYL
ncbi:MAG: hypothetical protein RSF81_06765 [Oscillospiraceae bacterium]